jgi:hypothetical protein
MFRSAERALTWASAIRAFEGSGTSLTTTTTTTGKANPEI